MVCSTSRCRLIETALPCPAPQSTADQACPAPPPCCSVKVTNAYDAAYGVEDPYFAITQLAQTTMRSEIGKMTLDKTFEERDELNGRIIEAINSATADWGISCMRYEIRDITPPHAVSQAMQMQAEAERRKREVLE